ncbi:hypothetical protein LY78DRAFT_197941 [Colletotrichum sublineola]|nr:hypothetical protein LY78DRAFT_197941 [Colletotrichum sublineola]
MQSKDLYTFVPGRIAQKQSVRLQSIPSQSIRSRGCNITRARLLQVLSLRGFEIGGSGDEDIRAKEEDDSRRPLVIKPHHDRAGCKGWVNYPANLERSSGDVPYTHGKSAVGLLNEQEHGTHIGVLLWGRHKLSRPWQSPEATSGA